MFWDAEYEPQNTGRNSRDRGNDLCPLATHWDRIDVLAGSPVAPLAYWMEIRGDCPHQECQP